MNWNNRIDKVGRRHGITPRGGCGAVGLGPLGTASDTLPSGGVARCGPLAWGECGGARCDTREGRARSCSVSGRVAARPWRRRGRRRRLAHCRQKAPRPPPATRLPAPGGPGTRARAHRPRLISPIPNCNGIYGGPRTRYRRDTRYPHPANRPQPR